MATTTTIDRDEQRQLCRAVSQELDRLGVAHLAATVRPLAAAAFPTGKAATEFADAWQAAIADDRFQRLPGKANGDR